MSLDVSRINLRGTDESLTLAYDVRPAGRGGAADVSEPALPGQAAVLGEHLRRLFECAEHHDVPGSTLQGDFRITQKYKRTDTFIYDFQYRRVAVNPATLQVSANLIPQLSQPVRVGGPGITWFHDKRQPSPLDATKGWYTSVQEFLRVVEVRFAGELQPDGRHQLHLLLLGTKHMYTFARNTRVGFETPFGANPNVGSPSCVTNTRALQALRFRTCSKPTPAAIAVPLPERLYAGGATSHRGFGINDAGPRDLQTGFPVGGNAVFVNTLELRLPPPVLPIVGDSVNFVIFHDMGNVFAHVGDMFPSFGRFHQPDQETCCQGFERTRDLQLQLLLPCHRSGRAVQDAGRSDPRRLQLQPQSAGVSGHLRLQRQSSVRGQAGHFNFFFSIGQASDHETASHVFRPASRRPPSVRHGYAGHGLRFGAFRLRAEPGRGLSIRATAAHGCRPPADGSRRRGRERRPDLESDVDAEERFAAFKPLRPDATESRDKLIERLIDRDLILQQMKLQPQRRSRTRRLTRSWRRLKKDIPQCAAYHCETDAGWEKFCADQGFTVEEVRERWRIRMEVLRSSRSGSGWASGSRRRDRRVLQEEAAAAYEKDNVPPPAEANDLRPHPGDSAAAAGDGAAG